MVISGWLLLLLFINQEVASSNTLINTFVVCRSTEDCHIAFNRSWCTSSSLLCVHSYCRALPDYPCKTTQICVERQQQCLDRACEQDSECDNQRFCDGIEICRSNICVTDPEQPSCLAQGGQCDEVRRRCQVPIIRSAWQETRNKMQSLVNALAPTTPTNNNVTDVSQLAVDVTAVIIIGVVIGVLFLVVIVTLISKSIRVGVRRRI
jgi:hypothetical protein